MSDRPTFYHAKTNAYVFGPGYDPAELTPINAAHWHLVERDARLQQIKAKAEADIIAVAPLWRQINDLVALLDPTHPGHETAKDRRAQIDGIIDKSNTDERRLVAARR